MKSIFIAGSRKFFRKIEELVQLCKKEVITALTAGKLSNQEDTLESEKAALFRAFEGIDKSDILFVMADEGYVGRTVALEIAYAFAKGKEIISSDEIKELSARALVSKVMGPEELIKYVQQPI